MIKLIVSDVDGTLVPAACRTPSAELTAALTQHAESGTIVALASGRPLTGLTNLFPELRAKLVYICCNGAAVVHQGQTISVSPLASGKALQELIGTFRQLHCDFMVNMMEHALAEETMSDAARQMITGSGIELEIIPDILELDVPILQVTTVCTDNLEKLMNHPCIKKLSRKYSIVRTGPSFFDVTSKTVDKGTAVAMLQNQFGILPEETIVFGDSMNDVPMFSKTPNSYAVENALDSVKSFAAYTVAGPENNGIADLLNAM